MLHEGPPHTHRNTSGAPGHGEGCEEEAGGGSRPRCSLFGGFPEPLLCFPVPTSKLASPKASPKVYWCLYPLCCPQPFPRCSCAELRLTPQS